MATIDPRTGQVIPEGPNIIGGGAGGGVNAQLAQVIAAQNQPSVQGPFGPQQIPPQVGPQVPPTGLIGAEQALQGGLQGALQGLQQGIGQGRSDISSSFGRGISGLQQFVGPGAQAQQQQGALSGAFGPEAQRLAFQQFNDSPGQAFLRERGELAVTRNASALGGLGGGRVQQELQRQGIGLAQQDFANQFNRLSQVTGQGLQAAGQAGQLFGQRGALLGNLGLQGGLTAADLARGTGRDLAFGRTRAGEQIAGGIQGTTSALSNLVNQQGQGLSELFAQGGGQLAGLLAGLGESQAGGNEQLAALLAQIRSGAAGQAAGLPGLPGTQQTEGIADDIGSLITAGATLSDERLKTNIRRVGETPAGRNVYQWDWTDEGKRLAGDQGTLGVIAQENPDLSFTGPDGFEMVDYARLT